VARHIWGHHLKGQSLPLPEYTALSLNIPIEEVHNSILMLSMLGFLTTQENSPNSYSLAEDAESFFEGLSFSFHTVILGSQERFGIP